MNDKKETIYPKGIVCFKKNDKAPDFIIGSMVITLDDFKAWVNENAGLLTEYNGKKQLRLTMAYSKKEQRPTITVDTWKTEPKQDHSNNIAPAGDDLPF